MGRDVEKGITSGCWVILLWRLRSVVRVWESGGECREMLVSGHRGQRRDISGV
jgi:hypothetical protein